MSRAAKHFTVLFFEEPLFEPDVSPRLDVRIERCGVTVLTPILPTGLSHVAIERAQRDLLDANLSERRIGASLVCWYYSPMALPFADHLSADVVVYDVMDELAAFAGAPERLKERERALFRLANVVFTGGQSLYGAKKDMHSHVALMPSSIDAAHFEVARQSLPDPVDQASIAKPRIGYFGVLDERLDQALVQQIAALRPDWQFVMIGPTAKIAAGDLPQAPNLHWLGKKDYAELPHYLAGWDVGFMPFALNEATRFISPTKTPEFLAAGLPVVSTPIKDVVDPYGAKGFVEIASTAAAFVEKIEALLTRERAPWLARVDAHLAKGSWNKTWDAMRRHIEDALEPAPSPKVKQHDLDVQVV